MNAEQEDHANGGYVEPQAWTIGDQSGCYIPFRSMAPAQEAETRHLLERMGIIGSDQDTAVSNLAGMTEGWAPAEGTPA
ncbi:hypothetical protein ACQ3HE_06725 [Plantibacter auratus]|uniref:hypothetical protein n=1 Tax=Plantibacter auratus TaxID=272914 RepID=UPI003D333AE1